MEKIAVEGKRTEVIARVCLVNEEECGEEECGEEECEWVTLRCVEVDGQLELEQLCEEACARALRASLRASPTAEEGH